MRIDIDPGLIDQIGECKRLEDELTLSGDSLCEYHRHEKLVRLTRLSAFVMDQLTDLIGEKLNELG